jgi:hypothetical protein
LHKFIDTNICILLKNKNIFGRNKYVQPIGRPTKKKAEKTSNRSKPEDGSGT